MRYLKISTGLIALLTTASFAFGGLTPYVETVKSKPVLINGFEFAAVTTARWIILNQNSPADSGLQRIEAQLWITNRTKKDRLFSVFDTFRVVIKDASGRELPVHGGRDHSMLVKPVLVRAGDTYCLTRSAGLQWSPGDRSAPGSKTQTFTYDDETGSWNGTVLAPGKYTFSFAISSNGVDQQMDFLFSDENAPGFEWKGHPPLWSGKGETPGIPFEVVDAPKN